MTADVHPRLDALPRSQHQLWADLRATNSLGFVLYVGTAIDLHLGHRPSVDFDFFSEQALDRDGLPASFPFIGRSIVFQDQEDAFSVLVPSVATPCADVLVSFFGPIMFGRVGEPRLTSDGVMQVASLDDLMATKWRSCSSASKRRTMSMSPPWCTSGSAHSRRGSASPTKL
jgi:hypothetical protein